jgi:hypothetical protein
MGRLRQLLMAPAGRLYLQKNSLSSIGSGNELRRVNRTSVHALHLGRIVETAIRTWCGRACGGL